MLSTTTSARPDLAAYRRSVEFPFPDLAQQLVGVLGKKLTAYVGGLKQARTVDGWIAGAQPYGDAEDRIRATYRIASMLAERLPASSVQRWFTGMNPDLGDQVALQLLRHGGIDERRRVLEAAIAYLAQG